MEHFNKANFTVKTYLGHDLDRSPMKVNVTLAWKFWVAGEETFKCCYLESNDFSRLVFSTSIYLIEIYAEENFFFNFDRVDHPTILFSFF